MNKSTWIKSGTIKDEHAKLPIRQIYVWFITSDNYVVIVGRRDKYQFPGGTPEPDESKEHTMKRELFEEAGLKLDSYKERPLFFGYYIVEGDVNPKWDVSPYLLIRYLLKTDKHSTDINLSVNEREDDTNQLEDAKFVPLMDLPEHISWTKDLEEYLDVLNIHKSL